MHDEYECAASFKSSSKRRNHMKSNRTKRSPRDNHLFVLQLTEYAMLTALVLVLTLTGLGYIAIGLSISITICHLPVILAAVMLGPTGGTIMGAIWGVTCLIKAFVAPPSPLEGIIFTNPIVTILPRILCGLIAGWVFRAISKHAKDSRVMVGAGVAALCGALANTIGVLSSLYFLYGNKFGTALNLAAPISAGGLGKYLWAAAALNAPIEIAVAVLFAVPVSYAVRKVMRRIQASAK
jgi:uncharacterized membrane protein